MKRALPIWRILDFLKEVSPDLLQAILQLRGSVDEQRLRRLYRIQARQLKFKHRMQRRVMRHQFKKSKRNKRRQ